MGSSLDPPELPRFLEPQSPDGIAIQIPANGSYGERTGRLQRKLFELLGRANALLYRRSGGTDPISRMWDFPTVLLTTTGARSGLARTSAIGGFPDGDDAWLVVATGVTGMARHPAWFLNLARNPGDVWLEVGKRRFRVSARSLHGAERRAAFERIAAISPRYAKTQAKTDRELPVLRLTVRSPDQPADRSGGPAQGSS